MEFFAQEAGRIDQQRCGGQRHQELLRRGAIKDGQIVDQLQYALIAPIDAKSGFGLRASDKAGVPNDSSKEVPEARSLKPEA